MKYIYIHGVQDSEGPRQDRIGNPEGDRWGPRPSAHGSHTVKEVCGSGFLKAADFTPDVQGPEKRFT